MSKERLKTIALILFLIISGPVLSQEELPDILLKSSLADSLRKSGIIFNEKKETPEINLTRDQSINFLQHRMLSQNWKDNRDPLRQAIGQIVFQASRPPLDSIEYFLNRYPFDSLYVPWDKFYIWEPLRLKIPYIAFPESPLPVDSLALSDTLRQAHIIDSLEAFDLRLPEPVSRSRPVVGLRDTTIFVVVDTLREVSSDYPGFPFNYYSYPYQTDSMLVAVETLLSFLRDRDSTIVNITGMGNAIVPVWLNSKSDLMKRYWLKNDLNDSVIVWVGSTDRNTLSLFSEQGVTFRRPARQVSYSEARVDVKEVDKSKLLGVQKIIIKPQYWKYRSEASFALNQGALSNWVKGGESNISSSLDLTGYADYNNKVLNVSSNNFARIKYGIIKSGDKDLRKNLDLLETNSKINHKAFGKFDFSGILLFKTQIAKGYNYPNDSVPVSKFMNPGILTAGIGLDYKPNKNTSLNFSPFSYKGTFVPDTAMIDQTKYGIDKERRSKHEPGASFLLTNIYKPGAKISVTNRLQLFTNYINNPQNIDIDWELILTASLNWFTDVRFNTHLIFDDDTKTVTLDDDKNPELGSDGKPKKTARIQFKEMLGFSFIFRF